MAKNHTGPNCIKPSPELTKLRQFKTLRTIYTASFNQYFRHIFSILMQFFLRLALAWTGSKIGLNEKLGKFKET